ncbi:MAG TPA: kelch repeat-containing protein [Paludibacteraceae bacterium]|nr:kelch repeat-containing protein [Paludibacteraceae bacterium]
MKKLFVFIVLFIALILSSNAQNYLTNTAAQPNHSIPKGPVVQTFEGTFPAFDWSLTAGSGNWVKSSERNHTSGGSFSAMYNCWGINGTVPAYLQTPEMIVTAGDATLTFWRNYYLLNNPNYGHAAELYIDISTDGGLTWTSGTTNYLDTITLNTWIQFTIDLTANIGQNVILRFKAISDFGSYNIAIDDIAGPSQNLPPHDLEILALTPSFVLSGSTIAPEVEVRNMGDATETSFSLHISDGGAYNCTVPVTTSISYGTTCTVYCPDWTPADGNYTLTANVILAPDTNTDNDTIKQNVLVSPDSWISWPAINSNRLTSYCASAGYTLSSGIYRFLYSFGGTGGNSKMVTSYNLETGTCTFGTDMPAYSKMNSAVTVGDFMYVNRGRWGTTNYNTFYKYDVLNNTWSTAANMPAALAYNAFAALNGNIYCVGGTTTGAVNTVYRYNIASNTWTTASPISLVGGLYAGGLAIADNKLVYIQGVVNGALTGDVFIGTVDTTNYDVITWTTGTPCPVGVFGIKAEPYTNGKIIYTGGSDNLSPLHVVPDSYIYDVNSDTWTRIQDKITPTLGYAAATFNMGGKMRYFVSAGQSASGSLLDKVEFFNHQIIAAACTGTPQASDITGPVSICSGTEATLHLSSTYALSDITYQWAYSTNLGGPYNNLGTSSAQSTGNLTSSTYYICTITCTNSGLSYTTAEKMVGVYPLATLSIITDHLCEGDSSYILLSLEGTGPWLIHGLTEIAASGSTNIFPDIIASQSPYLVSFKPNENSYYHVESVTDNTTGCYTDTANWVMVTLAPVPTANAGTDATYTSTPVLIGDPLNGPGIISWSPSEGLDNPTIAQPSASPLLTTTYNLTINNNGCIRTDAVTVASGGTGHAISGKTRYLKKANSGNPVPTPPSYNAVIYNIVNVEVKLKTSPGGVLLSTTMSDANGVYQFTNVPDGNYILAYDHIPYDTMQFVNQVNAVDLALLKYLIGHDTVIDPSRSFTAKHKKAANVDNNTTINTIDIARIASKVGLPYTPARNFPRGNWVTLDTSVTVAGSNLNITLQTVSYGDYDASSSRYKDSASTWGMAKSLPDENIIILSDASIMINDPEYFEVPLRISTKMNELSAVGLELSYPSDKYKLVSASMSNTGKKSDAIKINPTLEEIIAANNDLLVTDVDGVIRVVYATTYHFEIAANVELISLGFRSLNNPGRGELDFNLSGTGMIANQYGEINEDAYLTMPKIFVQGDDMEAGFEFAGNPNPFSGDATLTYNIPENGTVKLSVYNAIGELVTLLVNESQSSGTHSAVFSPLNLPAGMYTFKLEFTGSNKSKCLVLKMIH